MQRAPSCRNWVRRWVGIGVLVLTLTSLAFSSPPFDKSEFVARRAKLFDRIGDGAAIVLAAKPQVYPVKFRQSPDFYYLTGIEEPDAILLLVGPERQSFVFVRRRAVHEVMVEGPGILNLSDPAAMYDLTQALPLESFFKTLSDVAHRCKKVYLPLTPMDNVQNARDEIGQYEADAARHPLAPASSEMKQAIEKIRQSVAQLPVEDINPLIDELRWIKTPYEIERMRRSGAIAAEGVKEAIKATRPGVYEYELEAAARFVFTKRGCRGDAFTPIVASGPNTVTWHYSANNRQMQTGEVVLMDYGCDYEYYTSDITRTWPVSGRFTPEQEKMYRCIFDARNAVIAAMKPGVTIQRLQEIAEAEYKRHGFHREFLSLGRYIGHFVGISVHDPGDMTSPRPFAVGGVFNVEPILEIREKQIHLRLEDTVLITAKGAENLTAGVPAGIEEIYSLIKQKP